MKRRNSALIAGLVAAVCAIFMVGCGEDARFSNETQYLGGVYGPGPVSSSAPQDNVSYWDGDDIDGKPSVKITLGEQRAYFYKGGKLAGISQLSTGREGLNTPIGHFAIQQKDVNHVSSKYGDYVDAADNVVKPNVELGLIRSRPALILKARPCLILCAFMEVLECMPAISLAIPLPTVASGCRNSWRKISLSRSASARP